MRTILAVTTIAAALLTQLGVSAGETTEDAYLSWTEAQARAVGEQAYKKGRVGRFFDTRLLKTDRAYNYKLAATLLSPAVIRASARLLQLRSRLTAAETRELVAEAEAAGGLVVLVEIDPREGSGVIPLDWEAFLQPKGNPDAAIRGSNRPELRDTRALAGVLRRNYDYDRFWIVFPRDAAAIHRDASTDAIELVVRIHDKEGRVEWPSAVLRSE